LSWAKDRKLIREVPVIKMPKRAKRDNDAMKGRPIALEEFERMLQKCKAVGDRFEEGHRPVVIASWRFYLEGLWHSGLRREESLDLHWTDRTRLCVEDLDCDRPMIWIPGGKEKGNRDRVLPMAPEFAEFLREVPQGRRHGFVFNPLSRA
jgi:integrase